MTRKQFNDLLRMDLFMLGGEKWEDGDDSQQMFMRLSIDYTVSAPKRDIFNLVMPTANAFFDMLQESDGDDE